MIAAVLAAVLGALLWLASRPRGPSGDREPAARDAGVETRAGGSSTLQPRSQPASPPPLASGNTGSAVTRAEQRARRAAEDEPLTIDEARDLIAAALEIGAPERRYAGGDLDRMADAVMRIRAARRVIDRSRVDSASADVVAEARRRLVDALAELETVSGIPPSELTPMLEPDLAPRRHDDGEEPQEDNEPEYLPDPPSTRR